MYIDESSLLDILTEGVSQFACQRTSAPSCADVNRDPDSPGK